MGIMRFKFRSQLIADVDVTVVLPTDRLSYYDPSKDPPSPYIRHRISPDAFQYVPGMKFQTVYLMQGGGDDDSIIYRYTNIERYAQKNHVMLVSPNLKHGFGVDTNYGVPYSEFLTQELPVVIQSIFPSSPKREDNFIMGYAMGGAAALGNALMHPENYAACVDISGGIGLTLDTDRHISELRGHFGEWPFYVATFGTADELKGSRHDMVKAAENLLKSGITPPKFYVIVGSEEGMGNAKNIYSRVKADADILKQMGFDVTFICPEGYAHDWTIWDEYFKVALDELLPLRRAPIYP